MAYIPSKRQNSLDELTGVLLRQFTLSSLRDETSKMVADMIDLLAYIPDSIVTDLPDDPDASDPFTDDPSQARVAWTLGHVVAHTTASAEEAAFLAAELARGVPNHGRSRYETPWQALTSKEKCIARLEESLRLRLAALDMFPADEQIGVTYQPAPTSPLYDAVSYFRRGLKHDAEHLDQMKKIILQAQAAGPGKQEDGA